MEIYKKISKALYEIKYKKPLIHHITNYVTANDCANITLAIGASPVMADDINEVRDMVSLANSLVINLGTLSSRTVEAMILAGKRANELNIPIILDPVGVGATSYRTNIAREILKQIKISIVRGNLSEIKSLFGVDTKTKGVDSSEIILKKQEDLKNVQKFAKKFAKTFNTVVAITGYIDIVTDGENLYVTKNGNEMMSKITGTGCMCTSLIASFAGVEDDYIISALGGVIFMGIAGEIGYNKLNKDEGIGSLKVNIIDAIYKMSEEDLIKKGNFIENSSC
ncbi:hydroxyethylthiazole kinase [Defluviitalea phaphyphila]|uniref:hydroxyethylthiazole kinase n=1 Tax=Defluviitalea phaphyphila TaxID=1473580 RepID=UPI00072FBFF7|nr:hydroxyethylthiazole kinase [Defluviitalea phaphyphila]